MKAIVGKLVQGAADAGFVYLSDVAAAPELNQITLPAETRSPTSSTASASSKGAPNPDGAQEFIDGLLEGDGAEALAEAGFKPPPGG